MSSSLYPCQSVMIQEGKSRFNVSEDNYERCYHCRLTNYRFNATKRVSMGRITPADEESWIGKLCSEVCTLCRERVPDLVAVTTSTPVQDMSPEDPIAKTAIN